MEKINFDYVKQAARVFDRINKIRRCITRDRFAEVAKTCFKLTDEHQQDMLYGLLNITPKMVHYLAMFDNLEARKSLWFPKSLGHLPEAIEIAEHAYMLYKKSEAKSMPYIEHDDYRREDIRRYFYTDEDGKHTIDINLAYPTHIFMLSKLLESGAKINGLAEHLGYLEGEMKDCGRENFQYFEGDIYFLYADPADRMFYSYVNVEDAGVYVATRKGWRKLMYTPTRGYLTRDGNLDFVDDKHFYSDYMLEGSGKGFLYIGNIHDDCSVLAEEEDPANE